MVSIDEITPEDVAAHAAAYRAAAGPVPKDPDALLEDFMKTPLFMTSLPTGEDAEGNETLQALQSLVYEGNPDEIATNFKNQGNDCFQTGKSQYRNAIEYYSKGLAARSEDRKLNSILHSNRAAVNLELANYGKVLTDCAAALRLDVKNIKAFYRSAKALYALDRLKEALNCCDMGLEAAPTNAALKGERERIMKRQAELDELDRKRKERERKKAEDAERLWTAIRVR
ncbi:hypothetical protein BDK51DRAFT_49055 [Blyttiomyces helicus]|uniref:Uncharacterized protein n=1 Tax=Blyttiomyces helicus TaxID=388810 RepID=A0A4P9W1K9_9FUNG|nr:hypothetical protein BDK51DRAFT_49055 [Blyttiomyces helicus]|eukprot:RKO84460.1 hypothetical protein BDK51DRAFT_49055 [Blyttiomyces helicus]